MDHQDKVGLPVLRDNLELRVNRELQDNRVRKETQDRRVPQDNQELQGNLGPRGHRANRVNQANLAKLVLKDLKEHLDNQAHQDNLDNQDHQGNQELQVNQGPRDKTPQGHKTLVLGVNPVSMETGCQTLRTAPSIFSATQAGYGWTNIAPEGCGTTGFPIDVCLPTLPIARKLAPRLPLQPQVKTTWENSLQQSTLAKVSLLVLSLACEDYRSFKVYNV